MIDYLVSGYSGEAGGLHIHRWIVSAPNASAAKRRIRQSTLGYDRFLGEPICRLEAERASEIPDVLLENVRRVNFQSATVARERI